MLTLKRVKQVALGVVFVIISYGMVSLFGLCMGCVVLYHVIRKGPKVLENKHRKRPACLDDPSLGEHSIAQLQDVKIHYVANGNKDKPLMLCLHGFPEFWYSWRHQLREFASDYRVVAIDMRGYGESDKPRKISNYSTKHIVEDIKQLLPALGYQSCILMGHDWGGAIAWDVVSAYPELVDKLIILDAPHPDTFTDYLMKNKSQLVKSWYMPFFQVPRIPEMILSLDDMASFKDILSKESDIKSERMTSEDLEAYVYNFSPPRSFTCPINYYRAMFLPSILHQFGFGKTSVKKRTSSTEVRIPIPTVVIWGVHDSALETGLAEETKRHADDVTVRYVEGAGHFVQKDQPDKVNEYIRLFLNENKRKADLNYDGDPDTEMETQTTVETTIKSIIENKSERQLDPSVDAHLQEKLDSATESRVEQPTEPVFKPERVVKPEPKIEQLVETTIRSQHETKMEPSLEQNVEGRLEPERVVPTIPSKSETEMDTYVGQNIEVKSDKELVEPIILDTPETKLEADVDQNIRAQAEAECVEPSLPDRHETERKTDAVQNLEVHSEPVPVEPISSGRPQAEMEVDAQQNIEVKPKPEYVQPIIPGTHETERKTEQNRDVNSEPIPVEPLISGRPEAEVEADTEKNIEVKPEPEYVQPTITDTQETERKTGAEQNINVNSELVPVDPISSGRPEAEMEADAEQNIEVKPEPEYVESTTPNTHETERKTGADTLETEVEADMYQNIEVNSKEDHRKPIIPDKYETEGEAGAEQR